MTVGAIGISSGGGGSGGGGGGSSDGGSGTVSLDPRLLLHFSSHGSLFSLQLLQPIVTTL